MSGKLMAVLGAMLMFAAGALAQDTPEAQLVDVEDHWVRALTTADLLLLDIILADDYVDTDESGLQSKKADVVAALKSGALKIASLKLSNMHVHTYGNFAIVTGAATQTGTFKGQPLKSRIVFTDSFIMDLDGWRAVASHRTAVQGK